MSILYPSLCLTPPHPACHQIPSILLPPKYLSNLFSHPSPVSNPQPPWYFQSIADLYHTMSLLSSSPPSPAGRCCSKKQRDCNSLATVMGHRGSLGKDAPSSLCSLQPQVPLQALPLSRFSQSQFLVLNPVGYFLQGSRRVVPSMFQCLSLELTVSPSNCRDAHRG